MALEYVLFTVVWSIWFEKTKFKFKGKVYCFFLLVTQIKRRVSEWIAIYAPKYPYTMM